MRGDGELEERDVWIEKKGLQSLYNELQFVQSVTWGGGDQTKNPYVEFGSCYRSDFGTFCPSQASYFTGSDILLKNKKEIKIQFHILPSR